MDNQFSVFQGIFVVGQAVVFSHLLPQAGGRRAQLRGSVPFQPAQEVEGPAVRRFGAAAEESLYCPTRRPASRDPGAPLFSVFASCPGIG